MKKLQKLFALIVTATALVALPVAANANEMNSTETEFTATDIQEYSAVQEYSYTSEDFVDAGSSDEEVLTNDEVIQNYAAETQHTYGEPVFTWSSGCKTCVADFTCTGCGTTKSVKCTIDSETTAATCTAEGKTVYTATASFRGNTYTSIKEVVIKATGHTAVVDKAVSATCTSTGLTEGSHCSVCGTVIKKQETVAKKDHSYTTSTSGMVKTYTCKNCGYKKTEYVDGVYKASDGKWYYYVNGKKDLAYTGFASNSNGKWYVEKGVVTKNKQGILKDTTGAIGSKGSWYYVIGSKVQTDFTGLSNFKNENGWWYIKNGKVDFSAHGVYKNCNGWYYVDGGKVQFNYTGFASNSNGKWYIENGKVTFKKKGILKDTNGGIGSKNEWYYVIDSKVQTNFTGLSNFSNENGWWYITNGRVDRSVNTVAKNCNGWYYVVNGKVQHSFTGLANYKNANGWWYIKNGKVDFNAKGVYKNKNGWYYVENGKVQFSHNGVEKNSNGWWVIRNGRVDFSYTGLAANENGVWYCKNGKVQFSANGKKTINGITIKVSGGKATVSSSSLATGGNSSYRSVVNKTMLKEPANVLLDFVKSGGKVVLVNKFSWPNYTLANTAGVCSGNYIEIANNSASSDWAINHEFGHFVDWYCGNISGSTEFYNIMKSEIKNLRNEYGYYDLDVDVWNTLNTTEYFAESYKKYCESPSRLKKACPKTYAFIQKAIFSM